MLIRYSNQEQIYCTWYEHGTVRSWGRSIAVDAKHRGTCDILYVSRVLMRLFMAARADRAHGFRRPGRVTSTLAENYLLPQMSCNAQ